MHYLRIVLPNCATSVQWQHAANRISLDLERGLNNPSRALAAYSSLLARGRVTSTGHNARTRASVVGTLPHELAAQRVRKLRHHLLLIWTDPLSPHKLHNTPHAPRPTRRVT